MRPEGIAPRTALLAAVAGWALLCWLAALAGLGHRVSPLPDSAALRQPLPQLRPSPRERVGPVTLYAESSTRPLFSDDRKPRPFSLKPENEGEQVDTFDYQLTSVILAPQTKIAILQPTGGDGAGESIIVKLGEAAEQAAGWRLVSLDARQAVFEGPDGQQTMELRAFDGTGGQPATAATPTAAVAPPSRPGAAVNAANAAARAAQNAANGANAAANSAATRQQGSKAAPPQVAPIPAPPADAAAAAEPPATPDAQIEAIRQRIQARREQLRREAQQNRPPPPPSPDQPQTN